MSEGEVVGITRCAMCGFDAALTTEQVKAGLRYCSTCQADLERLAGVKDTLRKLIKTPDFVWFLDGYGWRELDSVLDELRHEQEKEDLWEEEGKPRS